MLGWMLGIGLALAGTLTELVEASGGEPVVAVRCDHARRVVGPMAAGQGMGLDAFSALSAGPDPVFDLDAPLAMAVMWLDGAARLLVEAGAADTEALAERLESPAFRDRLAPGTEVVRRGDRVLLSIPQEGTFAPSSLPVAARVDAVSSPGCAMVVDIQGVLAGAAAPIPFLEAATLLEVTFESPDGTHDAVIDVPSIAPELEAVLDGIGPRGLTTASSDVHFPVVLQVHGGVREVTRALSRLAAGADALVFSGIADSLPRRVRGEPGLMLALGGPEVGGALVVPLRRPRSPRRILGAVERMASHVGATVEPLPDGTLRVSPRNRPAVVAGARKGLLVVALLPEVVRDVLTDSGRPWLPPAEASYGVRLRAARGALPMLGPLDGMVALRYAGGALHVRVQPDAEE